MAPPCALVPLTIADGEMYADAGTTIGMRSSLTRSRSCFTTVRYKRGRCHADATCNMRRHAHATGFNRGVVSSHARLPYQHYTLDAALIHECCQRLGLR